jgi:hypothetical protein
MRVSADFARGRSPLPEKRKDKWQKEAWNEHKRSPQRNGTDRTLKGIGK